MTLSRLARRAALGGGLVLAANGAHARCLRVVRASAPGYPKVAEAANIEGTVRVDVVIDGETGSVVDIGAAAGPGLLMDVARDAARAWRFEPTGTRETCVLKFEF